MLEKHNVSPLSLNMSNTVRLGHSIEATNVAGNKSILRTQLRIPRS